MRYVSVAIAVAAALVLTGSRVGRVHAAEDGMGTSSHRTRFRARLLGLNETPPVSTTGSGRLTMTLDEDASTIEFSLSYENLEGGAVGAAHVHFAPPRVNGGVMFFFCGGGGQAPCPPAPATVTGVVTPANIVGPVNQGIAPTEFAAAVKALRAGFTYANVHTATFGGGEIRGQVVPGH
jgi:CHRD domain-containing protein